MTRRMLSGVIVATEPHGRATVSFFPHEVSGDGHGVCLVESGPARPFLRPPVKLVSLREVSGPARIHEHVHTSARLELSWSGTEEIGYLVMGEVEEG